MTSYNNVFGGPNVQPTTVSYVRYGTVADPFNANIQLNWAFSYVNNNNPVAQIMDVNPTIGGLVLTMPDATQASNGQQSQINNISNVALTVNKFDGTQLVVIANGDSYNVYLSDNSTQGGTWGAIQSGAIPAAPQPGALAGFGLLNQNNLLNTNVPVTILNANYTILNTDRAKLFVWTGGVGTFTLPLLATVGDGFYFAVNNNGNGTVTLTTMDGSTIDGNATFTINPGQSSSFIATNAGGLTWNSLGYGVETFSSINALPPLNIGVGGNITLTSQQASRQIQQFTGALAQNATIIYPAIPGQWYVFNNTTNAFTVTLQLNGSLNTIVIPQGQKIIVYSDGTNLYNAPTVATAAVFGDGTAGNPSIGFGTDTTSGFYKVAPGSMGYSSGANLTLTLGADGLEVHRGNGVYFYNTTNTNFVGLIAGTLTGNTTWTLPTTDATVANQLLKSNAAGALSFTTATYPNTTTNNQLLYSSAANVISGLATANNGVLITSAGGVPSIANTLPAAVQTNITQLGTITAGTWNGTTISVARGGTGLTTLTTAYGVVCAGTVATGALQNAGTGTVGQVLTSNGNAAIPSWRTGAFKLFGNFTNLSNANPTINQSVNIASIVRNSLGNYTITFTNAFTNTGYCVEITVSSNAPPIFSNYFNKTTNSIVVTSFNTVANLDPAELNITLIGT